MSDNKKCQSKSPENCPYHGALLRQEKALQELSKSYSEQALEEYFLSRKQLESQEAQQWVQAEADNPQLSQSWNSEIVTNITVTLPQIQETVPSILTQTLNKIAQEQSYIIDYSRFSPQALASQMGNILEEVYSQQFNNLYNESRTHFYIKGDSLSKIIKEARKETKTEDKKKVFDLLTKKYLFTEKYANEILDSKLKKAIHLPDVIQVNRTGKVPIIKCGEMKASGQNDSSSIPENIDKLVYGTRNSAIEAWSGKTDVEVKRAILITATTSNAEGKFIHKNKWSNDINKRQAAIGDIEVFCNEEAFTWLADKTITAEEYKKEFINTTAATALERVKLAS